MTAAPRILLADDQPDVLRALRLLLKPEGYLVTTASSPAEVLSRVREKEFDVALVDLNYTRDTTSGAEGLELLEELRRIDASLPVVVMTAWGTIELAVAAMKKGASDFVTKPWDNERMLATLRTQARLAAAVRRGERLEAEANATDGDTPLLLGRSAAMRAVLAVVERAGPSDAPVLITGENGTGKSVLARAIHAASSRAHRTFVAVNAGGLAEGVFESELFGHVRGAFTDAKTDRVGRFELADGGTLFLDEIANVPLALQVKLLRALETGELERLGSSRTLRVDVRIVSATNAELAKEVAAQRFRQDLLFRLNTIQLHLPPLRERIEDVPLLASHFLELHARRYKKTLRGIDPSAMQALVGHPWPGNIRELSHALERAVLFTTDDVIGANDLALAASAAADHALDNIEDMSLECVEELLIAKALRRAGGNVSHAAASLGLSRGALYRRMQRYGL